MAKRSKKRERHLTVFLLKDDITQSKHALKDPDSLTLRKLRDDLPFKGRFYFQPQQDRPPAWLSLARAGLAEPINLTNQSTAAVLFLSSAGRRFALTFGYGRNLLKPESFERNFGLKVALNTVDPKNLKSMDSRKFEDLTVATRRQASRGSELSAFGLDVTQDVLRAVTGKPRNADFARQVTGADALVIAVEAEFAELAAVCKKTLEAYGRDDYKEHFGFIDHMQPVVDPSLKTRLEAELLRALHAGESERMHLSPPEPINWEEVDGFVYPRQGDDNVQADLDIDEYLATLDDVEQIAIADLKRQRISVRFSGSGQAHPQWSVHDSIVFETDIGDHVYVLSAGGWYEVAKTFAKRVSKRLKSICASSLSLPDAGAGEKEGEYNERVANTGNYALMDQQNVRARDANSDIEVCDLFTPHGQFVHVKRKTRSATLSHLFAQGVMSGEAFHWDEDFRKGTKAKIAELKPALAKLIPDKRPTPGDFEVVYAIVTSMPANRWPAALPFFSQLNLVNARDRLERHG
jgi:uncharacterized protein (TIGR04141 family)